MIYNLRHKDNVLLKFDVSETSNYPNVQILWQNLDLKHLLPLDLEVSPDGVSKWLKHRTIPKNRAYVNAFLSKCGLNINRPMNIIKLSKGLSLNDCYWVVDDNFEGSFDKYNLYENNFNRILALIAFTGYGSSVRTSLESCPEFTTNGMLPKCWRRMSGRIMLYKGGTNGFSNTGNEPYSEFYSAQIAQKLGINAITYGLSKWKGELCSTCELFTSKDLSFMPIGRLVHSGDFLEIRDYYQKLGTEFVNALNDMVVFDAIICNTDRHLGNFGVMIDSNTNQIVAPAPIFDNGNSLFNFAGLDTLNSEQAFQEYVDTLLPCIYNDYIQEAISVLNDRHREGLRHLLEFKFTPHSSYNLPSNRLKLIESQVRKRAKILLDS